MKVKEPRGIGKRLADHNRKSRYVERNGSFAKATATRSSHKFVRLGEHDSESDASRSGIVSGYAAAALVTHGCWQPVMRYYLRVGMQCLTIVDECAAEPKQPLDDDILMPVFNQFHSNSSATTGALLSVGLSGRRDLLPRVRTA